jgi:hypothetical protein
MSRNVYLPGAPAMEVTPGGLARAGDVVHVKVSGLSAFGRVWSRGDTFRLEPQDIAHSVNRHGESFIDRELAMGADGKLGLGEWPADVPTWTPGSVEHQEAREAARREAHARPASERYDALQRVRDEFGESTPTSRTLNRAPDPTIRAAADQDERIRQNALRSVSRYTPAEREV